MGASIQGGAALLVLDDSASFVQDRVLIDPGLAVAWPLTKLLSMSPEVQGVLLLYAALPPAVMNYILAERYNQEPALVAAIVVVANIASIIFVPFALYLALPH